MKFYHVIIALLICIQVACSAKSNRNSDTSELHETPNISYDSFLHSLENTKNDIDSGDYSKTAQLLYTVINNDIPLYWTGTKWDFNGTTKKPKVGTIACGYFLTTVMDQTGYEIKRVWMAQQASSVLIKSYCSDVKITGSLKGLKAYLKEQPDSSCFILGLDFHTGFVTKNGDTFSFIHSNYIDGEGVIKESIDISEALATNEFFMIGSLTKNKERISEWMGW